MKMLSDFINRIANWKSLLIFLALYVSFPAYFLKNAEAKINELSGKTVGIIDLTMGFNTKQTLQMVADYGDAARAYYAQTEMTTDVAYPLVYAFFFAIVLTLVYRKTAYARINLLPFLAMLFDYAENVNIITLLRSFPEQSATVATLCEVFKWLKWLVFGAIILLIVAGLVARLLNMSHSATAKLSRRPTYSPPERQAWLFY